MLSSLKGGFPVSEKASSKAVSNDSSAAVVEKRTEKVTIRMTPEQKQLLERLAGGVELSAWIRQRVLNEGRPDLIVMQAAPGAKPWEDRFEFVEKMLGVVVKLIRDGEDKAKLNSSVIAESLATVSSSSKNILVVTRLLTNKVIELRDSVGVSLRDHQAHVDARLANIEAALGLESGNRDDRGY